MSEKKEDKELKEMDAEKLAALYDEISYRGFDPIEVVEDILARFSDPGSFGAGMQKICLAWIVGGPNPSRIAMNAEKNKVRNPEKATRYSQQVARLSQKLTPIVKAFVCPLLLVRKTLVVAGKIPQNELFYDSAFIGMHEDGTRASLDLGRSIAESAGRSFDEGATRRRIEKFGIMARKSQGETLAALFKNVGDGVGGKTIADMYPIYGEWYSKAKGPKPAVTSPKNDKSK